MGKTWLDREIRRIKKKPNVSDQEAGIKKYYSDVHIYNKKVSNNCYEIDSRLLDKRYVGLKKKRDGVKKLYFPDWCFLIVSTGMLYLYPVILNSDNPLSFLWIYLFIVVELIRMMQSKRRYYGLKESALIDVELSEIEKLFNDNKDTLKNMNIFKYWIFNLKHMIKYEYKKDQIHFIAYVLAALYLLIGVVL